MFLLSQSILIVLVSAVIGAFLARVFNLCTCNTEELQEELRIVRENRDELKRQITVGAGSVLTDAIGTRKAAVLEAELAELRSRADELAAANAKLRDGDGVDEDVAALKWRNKYLEARVLFFEGRDTGGSVETPPMPEHMTTAKLVQETEPAPVAFVSAAEEPAKRARKKSVVVPAPVLEPMVEPVTEPEVVAAPIVKKRKVKAVAPPPPPPAEPISNQNFTPSPLAGLSAEALEEAIALAGAGKAAPRSRRRANPDELLLIDGVGPKNKAWLNDQGIYYFYQIATMDIDQVAWLSKNLPTFGARVYRENWVAQCTKLARGEPAR
jgi:predicted flap endonuclease-1-like 5' DNA nuclease/cell division protein FtsB